VTTTEEPAAIHLAPPAGWTAAQRDQFLAWVRASSDGSDSLVEAPTSLRAASTKAAYSVVADLINQGWDLSCRPNEVLVRAPVVNGDPDAERERVRKQELLKRDEHLRRSSVRRFIERMETQRRHGDQQVSVFSLMRDGHDLVASLRAVSSRGSEQGSGLRSAIDPYVQVVASGERCQHSGLRLTDIWRYFRLTWTNQYTSTPGRTLMILVRDRAAPFHPVIGIAALGSPIVQLKERDDWIGWQRDGFLDEAQEQPTRRLATWVWRRLDQQLDELYLADLESDGLYWSNLWSDPTDDAIAKLEQEATRCRAEHRRTANPTDLKAKVDLSDPDALVRRATTPLFRSKRCQALAGLLRSRAALLPHFSAGATPTALSAALGERESRDAIAAVLRKAKGDAVGTEMADLTVCGAVAPYNELLGGKLVAMLAASPTVVRAYAERYGGSASEIASGMAGRAIVRRNQLVLLGTTSLYGANSSQYNRLSMPGQVLGGHSPIEYRRVGRSRSFGTSHLSSGSVDALVHLVEEASGTRVNSIFGEGVNPKLRKVRHGLDLLGWPSDDLLQHGRQRIIYSVSLVTNLLPYLIGLDTEPAYRFRSNVAGDTAKVVAWWAERWLDRRLGSDEALTRIESHRALDGSGSHGARVVLPEP
jgi:hypothetical protein